MNKKILPVASLRGAEPCEQDHIDQPKLGGIVADLGVDSLLIIDIMSF